MMCFQDLKYHFVDSLISEIEWDNKGKRKRILFDDYETELLYIIIYVTWLDRYA